LDDSIKLIYSNCVCPLNPYFIEKFIKETNWTVKNCIFIIHIQQCHVCSFILWKKNLAEKIALRLGGQK
jgi:plasmid maintenance system antidote protein VapI